MALTTWAQVDPRACRQAVYYEGEDTIREGMPLCYNYLSTKNWSNVDKSAVEGAATFDTSTPEGSQNEGKWIRVGSPVTIDVEDTIPASSSAVITAVSGDDEEFNNVKVGQFVTITGTDVTNGTYEVIAVTQGTENSTQGTITLDMTDATGSTADVRVVLDNSLWFAGAVAKGSPGIGVVGPSLVDIYVPNGAMIPVRTDKDCTIGDSLGLGSSVFEAATGDDDPAAVALCMETVNRSGTNGLVLAKLFPTGQQVLAGQAYFKPVRGAAGGYVYGVQVDGTKIFRGTAASKSYVMQISADRETGYVATGDSNDALLKIQGSNYALNDTNFILRGINVAMANRGSGTLGQLYGGNISISLKSGSGNIGTGIALQIDAQDLTSGTKSYFGGLDVAINREGTAATEEFGMRLRTRGTINTAMNTVFRIDKDATDHGFVNLFNIETDAVDVISASGDLTFTTGDILIPIVFNTNTYYIVCTDNT